MPRKAAVPAPEAAPTENNEAAGPPKVCYLDTFLESARLLGATAPRRCAPSAPNPQPPTPSLPPRARSPPTPAHPGVTEDRNLPADVKRSLAKLRDLDTQAQELYERMQKQSKNHIARAKRSVQGGHSPDEDLLLKAQKSSRELLEVDSEKVDVADQLYGEL